MSYKDDEPKWGSASFDAAFATIRENFRAIVMADAGVFSTASGFDIQFTTTGTATSSVVSARAGNGTTSSRNAYFRSVTLESAPQEWRWGMLGDKNYGIRDNTAGVTRVIIDTNGKVGIGVTPAESLHVSGNIRGDNGQLLLRGPNSSFNGMALRNSTGTDHWWIYENVGAAGQQGTLNVFDAVGGTTQFVIGLGGSGIGCSALTVNAGTTITKIGVYTPSLTPAAVAANTTAEQTFAVAGLTTTDTITLPSKPTAQAGLGIVGARVSAADTLAITFSNNTGASITPTAAQTYRFVAFRS